MENENEVEDQVEDPTALESDDDGSEGGDQKEKKRNEGIEKRINELTAKTHEAERRAAAAEATAQQQRDLNMQLLTQRGQPQEPIEDPYEDVDPKLRKMLSEGLTAQQRKFAAQLQAQKNEFDAILESQAVQHEASSLGLDPEISKEAAAIVKGAKSRGIPVNKEEVLDMLIGKAYREGKLAVQPSQTNPRRAAPLSGVRAPPIQEASQTQKPLPNNFDDLSPEEQLALLNKRGVGNMPL